MMSFSISKLFKHFHSSSGKEMKVAERDWRIITISFIVLNIVAIGGSLYLFWVSNSPDADIHASGQQKNEVFRQKNLDMLITKFNARKDAFARLQTDKATATDPSL
jgi:flagellar basal body-associated protein FliL